ncbi:hypothetical protein CONLIGDRAFT_77636 [Coniochaeta ligniaria NRRL 30616]|uniref:Rhodanese domain-containing protein n=1 Tax=Coniochaeta ligniaria NRRL 30616 TaxID=1408157 RepID=A0A1J7J598_9PEZI|nr:hypothetical protein CONLIGDRAFT_77636 [Coniochaeta ligniaria NRRL 30616]
MLFGPENLSGFRSILRQLIPARPYCGILTMTSATQGSAVPPPWHAAYPAPKIEARSITRETVLEMLRDGNKVASKDFVLIDLRRIDHQGGAIRGSINLPAYSLWPSIPTVYEIFKAAGLAKVI